MPKVMQKTPPMMGDGIVTKKAPTLLKAPSTNIITPAYCTTRRLPTLVTPMAPIFWLKLVVPFPVPQMPAIRQPSPSVPIPLFTAWIGGGGASVEVKCE